MFAVDCGFSHVTSSPGHASANGEAEQAVRTIKELLHAAKDSYIALLNYRSTPLANSYSPAELLMSRKFRTKLPVVAENLQASIPNKQDLRKKEEVAKLNLIHITLQNHCQFCRKVKRCGYQIEKRVDKYKIRSVTTPGLT